MGQLSLRAATAEKPTCCLEGPGTLEPGPSAAEAATVSTGSGGDERCEGRQRSRTATRSDGDAVSDDDRGGAVCRDAAGTEAMVRRSQDQHPGHWGQQAQTPRGGVSVVCQRQREGQREGHRLHGPIKGRWETGRVTLEATQGPDCVGHRKPR